MTSKEDYRFRLTILNLVNDDREIRGLPKLTGSFPLQKVAQPHTEKMDRENRLFHTNNLGAQVRAQGYNWTDLGENIAYATNGGTVEQVAQYIYSMWFNSSGHRANILDPDFRDLGIGYSRTGNTYWATQLFGRQK